MDADKLHAVRDSVFTLMLCVFRTLSRHILFATLRHADFSGCFQLTAAGLDAFVAICPSLEPSALYYCDNIVDGPYSESASGCRNLECGSRVCCRTGN